MTWFDSYDRGRRDGIILILQNLIKNCEEDMDILIDQKSIFRKAEDKHNAAIWEGKIQAIHEFKKNLEQAKNRVIFHPQYVLPAVRP